jgi:putative ABC transport system ATP-binding protein
LADGERHLKSAIRNLKSAIDKGFTLTILETREIRKQYVVGGETVTAVDGISLCIGQGDFVSIMGPSGSGKTTLLNLLGCIDRPTGGAILIRGRDTAKLRDHELDRVRLLEIGFIFQRVNLIPILTAIENVMQPMEIAGVPWGKRRERGMALLEQVGLKRRAAHRPAQLSAGEQQRVGIARSLANEPAVILADEPTGNLDSHTAAEISDLLRKLNKEQNQTLIVVTHNHEVGSIAPRRIVIRDGKISESSK